MDKALTEEDCTTAIGLARYAYEYIEAAMLVEHNDPTPTHISPVPAYFLALHGIELTLKSYLRHKDVTAKELRGPKYGHDLHACTASTTSWPPRATTISWSRPGPTCSTSTRAARTTRTT